MNESDEKIKDNSNRLSDAESTILLLKSLSGGGSGPNAEGSKNLID